jgi:hypothetical protein
MSTDQEIILCDGKLPKMLCACGRSVTRKNISTHRKTPIHKKLMQQYISGLDNRRLDPTEEMPVNALEVAKVVNKSKIRFLPQPIQDHIYEYAADMTAKNQFVKAMPQLFQYSSQPSLQKEMKFKFSKRHFQVMHPEGFQFAVTPINGLEALSDHVYKYARRWWAHRTEYDVNDKLGSLLRILRSSYDLPTVDTLHIITAQTFQLIHFIGDFDDEEDNIPRSIVPFHLRYLVSVNY